MVPPERPPSNSNNFIHSSKDLLPQQPSDFTSLKDSLNLKFLRSASLGAAELAGATTSLTSALPILSYSSNPTTVATASSSYISEPMVTTNDATTTSGRNKPGAEMTDLSNDGLMIANEDSTFCHDDGSAHVYDEQEELAKSTTLQSIERLENHLPRIVVEHLMGDLKRKKEQAKADKQNPLIHGSMTLEVPTSIPGAASPPLLKGKPEGVAPHGPKQTTRKSDMSDLLNTLTSLDQLLEEEFSSSEESSSEYDSEGESSEDGDSVGGSSDDDDCDSDDDESSEDEDEEEENNDDEDELKHSSATFFADDGVSDIDADDGLSDMDDDTEHDFGHEEDDDLTCTSEMRAASGTPGYSFSGIGSCASGGSRLCQFDASSHSGYNANRSTGSGHGSARRSLRSGNKNMAAAKNKPELEVGKLRQGRLNNRRMESDTTADDRSMSVDLTTLSTKSDGHQSHQTEVQSSHHVSAILFLDISGFTKLSCSLEVEALSEIINSYFEMIVSEIKDYGGDILKFAGDALIVEWTKEMLPPGQQHLPVTLLAALCASKLVDKCSDHPVEKDGKHICTLNLHCALGYGEVVGVHCGDMDRMEYIILGDSIQQIADGMEMSQLGEVVASPEAVKALLEGNHVEFTDGCGEGKSRTLAFKHDQRFRLKSTLTLPKLAPLPKVSALCRDWSSQELEDLQRRMSRYVHAVVYSDEFSKEEGTSTSGNRRMCNANVKSGQTQPELRDVFTVFIQPILSGKTEHLNGPNAGDVETLALLNSILFIVNSEITHYKAHLRQFIVDDKGLVVIANFGLRGSTFPNMIEERAIPCISNIRTLLKTELDLDCKMGATYGKAYCGVVGGMSRHEYTILGPSVNLAARLMVSKSNPGILVDEVVKSKSGERPFKALPPVKAKGYDDLVKIYNPNENVRKAWKNVSEEFVGRKDEVDILMRTAEAVMDDGCASKTVFISGPYGIGKSYVLSHVAQEVDNYCKRKGSQFHTSRLVFCDDDSFRPFSIVRPLFLDLLRRKQHIPAFGAAETAGHTESLNQKAEVEEAQLYVSLLQICLEAKIPMQYIEMFGGLIFSTKLSDIGTWSDRSRKMSEWNAIARHLVTAVLHTTADYDLFLLALDDVSGMDEMSWKILQRLYQRANNLLVIAAARNEFDLNINAEFWADLNEEGIQSGRFRHLRMAPMKLEDVGQLACKRLGMLACNLDDTLSKTVSCQSRGNPLLACEILDVMYRDDVSSENGVSGASLHKIEELLLNRLDELSPMDRSHLNLGSILGFTFAEKDVVLVMERYNDVRAEDRERHAQNVHNSLQVSVQFGILKRSDVGNMIKYTFAHALWMKTIALHILDAWKDEMRALIDVATTDGDIAIKYDWDELAKVKTDLQAMREQNFSILQSIMELRSLIDRAR